MTPAELKVFTCHDSDGSDSEEQSWMLIAAESPLDVADTWRHALGLSLCDHGELVIERAVWNWPTIPEPTPSRPGVFWPTERTEFGAAFRGYGFSEEGDVRCEDCGDRVDPADAQAHDNGFGPYHVCRWCSP